MPLKLQGLQVWFEFCFLSQVLWQEAPSILADVAEPGGIPRNNEGLSKHRNIVIIS